MPVELYGPVAGGGGGGSISIGVGTDGNTAGTTGTVSNGLLLVGGTNITLSQSTGVGGATVTIVGPSPTTLLEWPPQQNAGLTELVNAALYSGSTSANGASTHSTLSYYVQPFEIQNYVKASRIDLELVDAGTNGGTGSVSDYHYLGLYKLTPASDSLTLVSSWFAGMLCSANSITQMTMSLVTGSNSGSIVSVAGNSSAHLTGGNKVMAIQMGATSLIPPDAYFAVNARHSRTSGANVFSVQLGGAKQNISGDFGSATTHLYASVPLFGAFSSTSSTNVANSNQWLMPPSIATNLILGSTSTQFLPLYMKFRGI